MNSVIVFDVTENATQTVRERLRTIGYNTIWTVNLPTNQVLQYNLPHNMIWRSNTEIQQALNDINGIISQINATNAGQPQVELSRCIILNSTPWGGVPGIAL